ncbi:MAG: hypothetical protein LBD74_04060 [Spirochaetaceae bacterium]|jgi:hypothetical protein|nr:hypothetical protein [Spirochaetaceae bacterium]
MQKLVLVLIAFIAMVTFIRVFDKAEAEMRDTTERAVTVSESHAEK